MDHIDQAIYDTVHSSDMSAKEIASLMGLSHQVLLNKSNPQSEHHKITLRESVAIQLITGSRRISRAMALELEANDPTTKRIGVLQAVVNASSEHGDVVKTIQQAMADNALTLREKELCQKEIDEAIEALNRLRLELGSVDR